MVEAGPVSEEEGVIEKEQLIKMDDVTKSPTSPELGP